MGFLTPDISGRQLTVDAVMNSPTLVRDRIAAIADEQLLLGKLFDTYGGQLAGGGLLYASVQASDYFAENGVTRTPGTEYGRLMGSEPHMEVAPAQDFGVHFDVPDEMVLRNDYPLLDYLVAQSANTLTRQLDEIAVQSVEYALQTAPEQVITGHTWKNLVTVGPLDALTAASALPTADFAAAQNVADLQEIGVKFDLLVCHPNEAMNLRTAYRQYLGDALQGAGLELFVTPRVEAGNAYLAVKGQVGIVAFEVPLRVEPIIQREKRNTRFNAYVVPAVGVDRPNNIVKLTGLAA